MYVVVAASFALVVNSLLILYASLLLEREG